MSYDSDPYIFNTDSLPTDPRFLPPLANGLLGWRVYNHVMHVGGVYNGEGGRCHRADVPCPLAVEVKLEEPAVQEYTLDTRTGTPPPPTEEVYCSSEKRLTVPSPPPPGVFTHTLSTPSVTVSQTFYSHRCYSNLMVMEVLIVRHVTSEEPFTVEMVGSFTPQSKDINFQFGPDYKGGR